MSYCQDDGRCYICDPIEPDYREAEERDYWTEDKDQRAEERTS